MNLRHTLHAFTTGILKSKQPPHGFTTYVLNLKHTLHGFTMGVLKSKRHLNGFATYVMNLKHTLHGFTTDVLKSKELLLQLCLGCFKSKLTSVGTAVILAGNTNLWVIVVGLNSVGIGIPSSPVGFKVLS